MAIEAFPKPKIKGVYWPRVFSYILTGAFLILISSYFIMVFMQGRMNQALLALEDKLAKTPEEQELEKRIVDSRKRINDWKSLIALHTMPLGVFDFLQLKTHPEVWFSDFKMNIAGSSLTLGGRAKSFEVLSQQLKIFEGEKSLRGMNLSGVAVAEGGEITFTLNLQFDQSVFKQ